MAINEQDIVLNQVNSVQELSVANQVSGTPEAPIEGKSITSIKLTSSDGLVDTYTINFTDGSTSKFKVTNGKIGEDGKGIKNISKTSTVGLVDTYTILFTDDTTTTFTVTNGKDGKDADPYVLTEEDTQEIINSVLSQVPSGSGGSEFEKVLDIDLAMEEGVTSLSWDLTKTDTVKEAILYLDLPVSTTTGVTSNILITPKINNVAFGYYLLNVKLSSISCKTWFKVDMVKGYLLNASTSVGMNTNKTQVYHQLINGVQKNNGKFEITFSQIYKADTNVKGQLYLKY